MNANERERERKKNARSIQVAWNVKSEANRCKCRGIMYGIYIMKIVISALAIIECERVTSIIAAFEREAIVYRTFICSVCMSQILQSSEREKKMYTTNVYMYYVRCELRMFEWWCCCCCCWCCCCGWQFVSVEWQHVFSALIALAHTNSTQSPMCMKRINVCYFVG